MPLASVNTLRLVPRFARSVGFGPVLFPPERRFGHRPVHRKPIPVDANQRIVLQQTALPDLQEHARLDPFLKSSMGGRGRAQTGGVQRVPLAAGPQHEEDGVQGRSVRDTGPMAAQGMLLAFGQERLDRLPQLVRHAPIPTDTLVLALTRVFCRVFCLDFMTHAISISPTGIGSNIPDELITLIKLA
jgi:hypothetical protein